MSRRRHPRRDPADRARHPDELPCRVGEHRGYRPLRAPNFYELHYWLYKSNPAGTSTTGTRPSPAAARGQRRLNDIPSFGPAVGRPLLASYPTPMARTRARHNHESLVYAGSAGGGAQRGPGPRSCPGVTPIAGSRQRPTRPGIVSQGFVRLGRIVGDPASRLASFRRHAGSAVVERPIAKPRPAATGDPPLDSGRAGRPPRPERSTATSPRVPSPAIASENDPSPMTDLAADAAAAPSGVIATEDERYNASLVRRVDQHESLGYFWVRFDGEPTPFEPGQYMTIGVVRRRARSCSGRIRWPPRRAWPARPGYEFYLRLVQGGTFTPLLWDLPVGHRMRMIGPKGKFLLEPDDDRTHLFISSGTGNAPVRLDDARHARRGRPATGGLPERRSLRRRPGLSRTCWRTGRPPASIRSRSFPPSHAPTTRERGLDGAARAASSRSWPGRATSWA